MKAHPTGGRDPQHISYLGGVGKLRVGRGLGCVGDLHVLTSGEIPGSYLSPVTVPELASISYHAT